MRDKCSFKKSYLFSSLRLTFFLSQLFYTKKNSFSSAKNGISFTRIVYILISSDAWSCVDLGVATINPRHSTELSYCYARLCDGTTLLFTHKTWNVFIRWWSDHKDSFEGESFFPFKYSSASPLFLNCKHCLLWVFRIHLEEKYSHIFYFFPPEMLVCYLVLAQPGTLLSSFLSFFLQNKYFKKDLVCPVLHFFLNEI